MSAELFSIEYEQSVIGGLLIDPKSFDRIDFITEADFYREEHRLIYGAIALLLSDRKPVDVITVAEFLKSSGVDESRVGLAYLGELQMNTPSAANIRHYAEAVREKRLLRNLLEVSGSISELAEADSKIPAAERIDQAEQLVYALSESTDLGEAEARTITSVLTEVVDDIQARFDAGGEIAGMSTGLVDLDAKTCGMMPGDLIIIAGRPSMGKTAIALNIAENAAVELNKSVLVFSMEMPAKSLGNRLVSSIGRIRMDAIRTGKMSDDDFGKLSFALGKLHQSKLHIDDRGGLSVPQMRSRCRRVARKFGLDLIVVDYIQLATANLGKSSNREQEVSAISRGLKGIAKEFNCPVIALSQLSRKVEDRADKRPMMSDLRESGAIEQDADVIMMMYRDEYYYKDSSYQGIAEIIIAKQRMGETGALFTSFQGEFSRFGNLSPDAIRHANESHRPAARKSSRGME